jgi:PAS domain S-box-containing protein
MRHRFLALVAVLFGLVFLSWTYGEYRLESLRSEDANRVASFIEFYSIIQSTEPGLVIAPPNEQLLRSFLISSNFDCTEIASQAGQVFFSWPTGCERFSRNRSDYFQYQDIRETGEYVRILINKSAIIYPIIFEFLIIISFIIVVMVIFFSVWQIRRRKLVRESQHRTQRTINRLESVLANALDCIISINIEGRVLSFNPAAERCFGYKETEVKGKILSDLIIPEPLREAHQLALRRFQEFGRGKLIGERIEVQALRSNGDVFPVELTLAAIESEAGPVFFGFIRDITNRKAAEASLMEARDAAQAANRAKSDFLAVMSHEMRTPMNVILGMTDLVLDSNLEASQERRLQQVSEAGDTLLKLINQILDLAKIEAGKMQLFPAPSDIRSMVLEQVDMLEPMASKKGLSLSASVDHNLAPSYDCDVARLKQVLSNLINNAVKFTENGSVLVNLKRIQSKEDVDRLLFEVADTGIGISSEAQQSIFEHFVQEDTTRSRRHEGTGLGLAIAREIITRMGGEIGVESEHRAGSCFWFMLDLERSDEHEGDRVQKRAVSAMPGESVSLGLNILLAEDNAANRSLALAYLKKLGCQTIAVANGKEALDSLDSHVFDAILMDVQMPEMDGIEATKYIRTTGSQAQHIPVIALTANAMPEDVQECLSIGMSDVLAKPLKFPELKRVLTRVAQLAK